jgi:hypothetical protein
MRDPYDVLGVARGASRDEIKAAYRRASKSKHPDVGGSNEAMVELNTAYAYILNELKRGYQEQQRERASTRGQAGQAEQQDDRDWERAYRDIDEELEAMRRATEAHEEALRTMRAGAWEAGDRTTWAKLTWQDLARFIRGIARGGVKGLAVLFAAIVGVGSIFVEANFVSALILLGSGIGFAFSLALKNDKGGIMSAALLLFGVMTIWLPPVRAALFLHPLATISVLILLALIFKFAQQGGTVGMMTGGLLALYVIGVIVGDTLPHGQQIAVGPPGYETPPIPKPPVPETQRPGTPTPPQPPPVVPEARKPDIPTAPQPPPPPEPRTLLAAKGAQLKFVAGVPYHLNVRTGFTTSLRATQGKVAFISGGDNLGECVDAFEFSMQAGTAPYKEIDRMLRACGGDALMIVSDVR